MQSEIKVIPIRLIRFPSTLLRLINRSTLEYRELRDSIKSVGLLNSICVRPVDNQYRSNIFEIIDGVHRYSICRDLGWQEIPCIILENVSDEKISLLQIHANSHKRTTSHAEYATVIKGILLENPDLSLDDLCAKLNKTSAWVRKVMALLQLIDKAKEALTLRQISLMSAYALAKLPKQMQEKVLPWAMVMRSKVVAELCGGIIRGYREAKARDCLETFLKDSLDAPRYLRSFKQISFDYDLCSVGAALIQKYDLKRPIDVWRMALAWILHVDPVSSQAFKARMEKRRLKLNEAALTRKMDRKRQQQALRMKIENKNFKEIMT